MSTILILVAIEVLGCGFSEDSSSRRTLNRISKQGILINHHYHMTN